MYAHTREAAARVSAAIRARLKDEVRGIYLFGSRVRGDHGPDSDLDLLVVVGVRSPAAESAVIDSCVAEELNSGVAFDPVIKGAASFARERRYGSPFYQNVARDGIAV